MGFERRIEDLDQTELNNALCVACEDGDIEMVRKLIEAGSDVKYNSSLCLVYAVTKGNVEIAKIVMDLGADINIQGNRAFVWAAINGHLDMCKFIVDSARESLEEALTGAATNGHFELVEFLVEQGANVSYANCEALVKASTFGYIDIVDFLLGKGLTLDVVISRGDRKTSEWASSYKNSRDMASKLKSELTSKTITKRSKI